MRFKVPQFIDIEDKVFGPFTFKQFVYLIGGAGLSFVLYRTLPTFIAVILILPVIGLSLALTFYRINNKPFVFVMQAYIKYLIQGKLYLWKKDNKKKSIKKKVEKEVEDSTVPKLSGSKLKEMSWSLDVLDVNKEEQ